jgi:hypothetical protein
MSEIRKLLDENVTLPLWPENRKGFRLKTGFDLCRRRTWGHQDGALRSLEEGAHRLAEGEARPRRAGRVSREHFINPASACSR